jgi:hypothetical protein
MWLWFEIQAKLRHTRCGYKQDPQRTATTSLSLYSWSFSQGTLYIPVVLSSKSSVTGRRKPPGPKAVNFRAVHCQPLARLRCRCTWSSSQVNWQQVVYALSCTRFPWKCPDVFQLIFDAFLLAFFSHSLVTSSCSINPAGSLTLPQNQSPPYRSHYKIPPPVPLHSSWTAWYLKFK